MLAVRNRALDLAGTGVPENKSWIPVQYSDDLFGYSIRNRHRDVNPGLRTSGHDALAL